MPEYDPSKNIEYLGRDFDTIKQGLVEFVKNYYPNTYNDFNEASPGMMFLELMAYVGDTLNYYIDSQFKESQLLQATERRNVLAIAAAMGYKPLTSVPANVDLDIFQLMPSTGTGDNAAPDMRYALRIQPGMQAQATLSTLIDNTYQSQDQSDTVDFYIQEAVDFSIDTADDPIEFQVYSIDAAGNPEYYLAKKTAKAVSATPTVYEEVVGAVKKFYKFKIPFDDINTPTFIGIDSIVDSDGNTWTEVPYLAQDTVFESIQNTALNDPDAAVYSDEIPYLLKLKKVPRRFVTRILDDGIEIQFGSGISTSADEELLPTPENIGLNLPTGKINIDQSIDPNSPGVTKAYGIAPSNTTLTVTYLTGGGIRSNVTSDTITNITALDTNTNGFPNTGTLNTTVLNSVACNNPNPAFGGRSQETLDEVRQNAIKQLSSQNRAVTRDDYMVRAITMPPKFGSVSKVFITPDEQNNLLTSDTTDTVSNPLAMNMYVLGYDSNKNLTTTNRAVKENLKTYLSQYRMLTDSINLRDAFIINIQVNFDIIPLGDRNANQVLLTCVNAIKDYFDVEKWQINQPIQYTDIYNILLRQPGVQTVTNVVINNLNDSSLGYSNIAYNIKEATRNGIIYPSLDPMIFEVKLPDNDIKGRIVNY
jgi:hypothetical protein|tara:strand:+ start:153 stop:2093 length:1941 start_codon:yes stop_codon:yes gene_type:complete